jgi:hypothetical protein
MLAMYRFAAAEPFTRRAGFRPFALFVARRFVVLVLTRTAARLRRGLLDPTEPPFIHGASMDCTAGVCCDIACAVPP